jgi:DNA topoisomerase-3
VPSIAHHSNFSSVPPFPIMKTLVIAEKPSVAADLARVLKVPKKDDLFENDTLIITSAIGHIVELEMPEDIDPKLRFWRLEPLPILPKSFGLKPSPKTKDRFLRLKKLFARSDVSTVVNACDAGREGELIFAYIYQLAKARIPVKRAWMQTMTADGIRSAFASLRDGAEMRGLEDAARCRSESDWLIGINGTRVVTKRMFGSRAGNVATVGRVQTPTLAIVVNREKEIRNFVPCDYWRLTASFLIANGSYEGVWQRPEFKKDPANEHDRADRIWDKALAQTILAECNAPPPQASVSDEKKSASQLPPRLYDLTSLQREANSRFGLPARRTLQIAQSLYERHKVITYPRTDSRALPEDYVPTCRDTLAKLENDLAEHARLALDSGWVRPNKRIFNNAQISDHFAIIPTGTSAAKLDEIEAKIYDMIARRFVAAFHPPAQFDVTTRISTLHSHAFKSEGKVLTAPGWLAVYGKASIENFLGSPLPPSAPTSESENSASPSPKKSSVLPPLSPSDGAPPTATAKKVSLTEETTKPPARYNEATLLSAMEGAGKLVDDEELADAMKERGLGTPATRAEIIEGLVFQNYLERNKRELSSTTKAEELLEFLAAVKADALTKPDMTAEWEYKLRRMEQNQFPRDTFMSEVVNVTKGLVERTKHYSEDASETSSLSDIPSPTDQKPLLETLRTYRSQDGLLTIYKSITGRKIEPDEVRTLLANGEVGPLDDFVSPRTNKHFSAKLKLVPDKKDPAKKKVELDFGDKVDHATLSPFWTDPATAAELCESPTDYILRQASPGADYKELFKLGRLICQKPLTREHAIQLVSTGKTELIRGFISKKGRPFDAYLLRKDTRIAWEFPPREPRKTNAKSTTSASPDKSDTPAPLNLAKAENLGPSKRHPNATLFRSETEFLVAKNWDSPHPLILLRIPRILCGVELPPDEIQRLVTDGSTNIIEGMLSKRNTKFKASLVLSKNAEKFQFSFPPRES